mmetsp:Transcript_19392/g.28722  ORF Transcript_19392/g.28722 Transcript_19392/m.28722 type:complete len:398 (-) Transcript_19392:2157-3350(-)
MENGYHQEANHDTNLDSDLPVRTCSKDKPLKPKFSKAEKDDLVQTLDHILTAGATLERKVNRQKRFQTNLKGKVDIGQSKSVVNLEDQRIYNNNGNDTMVKKVDELQDKSLRKRRYDMEMLWDEEHGDSVHPITFLKSKLVTNQKSTSQNKEKLSKHDSTTTEPKGKQAPIFHEPMAPLSTEEVPKAILVRCWQRAVHAASSTVIVETEKLEEKEAARRNRLDGVKKRRCSSENIKAECRYLKISLPENEKICPSCKMVFLSPEECARHYYGIPSNSGSSKLDNVVMRGCCLELLEEQRRYFIGKSLEREVTATIKQIGQLIWTSADTKMREGQYLSWCDVVNNLHTIVAQSEPLEEGKCNITKIQPNETQLPIALNASVMDVVRSRLVDRYANIPR